MGNLGAGGRHLVGAGADALYHPSQLVAHRQRCGQHTASGGAALVWVGHQILLRDAMHDAPHFRGLSAQWLQHPAAHLPQQRTRNERNAQTGNDRRGTDHSPDTLAQIRLGHDAEQYPCRVRLSRRERLDDVQVRPHRELRRATRAHRLNHLGWYPSFFSRFAGHSLVGVRDHLTAAADQCHPARTQERCMRQQSRNVIQRQIDCGDAEETLTLENGSADGGHEHLLALDRIEVGLHDGFALLAARLQVPVAIAGFFVVNQLFHTDALARPIPPRDEPPRFVVRRIGVDEFRVAPIERIRLPRGRRPN
nr:hypothetical protein [Tepidimonas taiwanensis]